MVRVQVLSPGQLRAAPKRRQDLDNTSACARHSSVAPQFRDRHAAPTSVHCPSAAVARDALRHAAMRKGRTVTVARLRWSSHGAHSVFADTVPPQCSPFRCLQRLPRDSGRPAQRVVRGTSPPRRKDCPPPDQPLIKFRGDLFECLVLGLRYAQEYEAQCQHTHA